MGGLSDSSNLALACPSCNFHKANRLSVTNSFNGEVIPLFNPRIDDWNNHFEWDDYTLISKSEIGRVTIQALDLNHERRIRIRRAEQLFGLFPPDHNSDLASTSRFMLSSCFPVEILLMIAPKRKQNAYDHRLRELVFRSGRTQTAKRIGVLRSTIHGWTKARPQPVLTLTAEGDYVESLEKRVYLLHD
jgi:hypothetical protein